MARGSALGSEHIAGMNAPSVGVGVGPAGPAGWRHAHGRKTSPLTAAGRNQQLFVPVHFPEIPAKPDPDLTPRLRKFRSALLYGKTWGQEGPAVNATVKRAEITTFRTLSRSAQPVHVIATQPTQSPFTALASFGAKTAPPSEGPEAGLLPTMLAARVSSGSEPAQRPREATMPSVRTEPLCPRVPTGQPVRPSKLRGQSRVPSHPQSMHGTQLPLGDFGGYPGKAWPSCGE